MAALCVCVCVCVGVWVGVLNRFLGVTFVHVLFDWLIVVARVGGGGGGGGGGVAVVVVVAVVSCGSLFAGLRLLRFFRSHFSLLFL